MKHRSTLFYNFTQFAWIVINVHDILHKIYVKYDMLPNTRTSVDIWLVQDI